MITENVSTLKIHRLTQAQYDRELEAGNINENEIYLTPDEGGDSNIIPLTDEEIEAICTFEGDPNNLIPIATHSSIGSVAVGDGLDIDNEGNLSVISLTDQEIENICEFDEGMTEDNIIPKATRHAFGCVKVGNGLAIDANGRLYVTGDIVAVGGTGSGIGGSVPIGTILEFGGTEPPENWLLLNGQEVDRVAYAELFQLYGTAYGEGDGSTTFNLPDFRGKVPIGLDERDEDFNTLGNTGGEKTHKLTVAEMPSHSHGLTVRGSATSTSWIIDFQNVTGQSTSTGSTGGSQAHNNLQPYIVINYIVKAKAEVADLTLTEEKDIQELLWTNPNPSDEFAVQTINLDLSGYDAVRIEYRPFNSYSGTKSVTAPIGTTALGDLSMSNLGLVNGTNTYNGFRHMEITETGINVQQGYNHSAADNRSVIPVRIYGIKNKINVTTAVVTDKGQHTDLLWENASPTAEFAAQTINLDLNGYDAVKIIYTMDTGGIEQQSLKANMGSTCRLDIIGQSSGKPFVARRNVTVNTSYINFESAYYVTTSTSDWVSSTVHIIPYQIYGIKHNISTTSTIMGDYIVEEGTDGIWTYRKWNSGIAECWGTTDGVATGTLSASGSIYYKSGLKVATIPTNLFTSTETIIGSQTSFSSIGWLSSVHLDGNDVVIVFNREQSGTTNVSIAIQVKGRWK